MDRGQSAYRGLGSGKFHGDRLNRQALDAPVVDQPYFAFSAISIWLYSNSNIFFVFDIQSDIPQNVYKYSLNG